MVCSHMFWQDTKSEWMIKKQLSSQSSIYEFIDFERDSQICFCHESDISRFNEINLSQHRWRIFTCCWAVSDEILITQSWVEWWHLSVSIPSTLYQATQYFKLLSPVSRFSLLEDPWPWVRIPSVILSECVKSQTQPTYARYEGQATIGSLIDKLIVVPRRLSVYTTI